MHRLTHNIKKYQVAVFAFTLLLSGAWSVDFTSAATTLSDSASTAITPSFSSTAAQNAASATSTTADPYSAAITPSFSSGNTNASGNSSSAQNASSGSGNSSSNNSSCSGSGICIPDNTGLPSGTVSDILTNFFKWLLIIFSIFAVGAFIISGIQYLISAGDDKSIATAKMNMKWSIIGVAVGLSGYIILTAVQVALNASSTTF